MAIFCYPEGVVSTKKLDIQKILEEFAKKLPKFPDGRIDYSNSDAAAVVIIFVRWNDKILLLKRSDKVRAYQDKWSTVAGYLDELRPIEDKVLEELLEEAGISAKLIAAVKIGTTYTFSDREIHKKWIRVPVIVDLLEKPIIRLDWEHTEWQWIDPQKLAEYDTEMRLDLTWQHAQK